MMLGKSPKYTPTTEKIKHDPIVNMSCKNMTRGNQYIVEENGILKNNNIGTSAIKPNNKYIVFDKTILTGITALGKQTS